MNMSKQGLGREEDFSEVDLTGKLGLIQRGAMNPFQRSKCTKTRCSWCFDLQCSANINMAIDDEAKKIFSLFLKQYGVASPKSGNYKIVFNDKMIIALLDVANQLSDFQVGE